MAETKEVATVAPSQGEQMLSIVMEAAKDPGVTADKMKAFLDMQLVVMDKQAEIDFNEAFARMRPKLPVITKKGRIEFVDKNSEKRSTPFAKYEDIAMAIRPLLAEEGFSISFNTEWGDAGVMITGTLAHKGGHSRPASMRLPLDTSGSKNNLQAMGSTISYGKRYLVGMLLDIITVGEDDDGGGADGYITEELAKDIDQRIKALPDGADYRPKFLSYMKVEGTDKILPKDYMRAINALKAKEKGEKKPKVETK